MSSPQYHMTCDDVSAEPATSELYKAIVAGDCQIQRIPHPLKENTWTEGKKWKRSIATVTTSTTERQRQAGGASRHVIQGVVWLYNKHSERLGRFLCLYLAKLEQTLALLTAQRESCCFACESSDGCYTLQVFPLGIVYCTLSVLSVCLYAGMYVCMGRAVCLRLRLYWPVHPLLSWGVYSSLPS